MRCPKGSTGVVPGTSGTGGQSGCVREPGWWGAVVATSTPPKYVSTLAPADCPAPGSTGKVPGIKGAGGESDCVVDKGYSGQVVAAAAPPHYVSTVAAVGCPPGSEGTVPGTSGTNGASGCTTRAGFDGYVVATSSPPHFFIRYRGGAGVGKSKRVASATSDGNLAYLVPGPPRPMPTLRPPHYRLRRRQYPHRSPVDVRGRGRRTLCVRRRAFRCPHVRVCRGVQG